MRRKDRVVVESPRLEDRRREVRQGRRRRVVRTVLVIAVLVSASSGAWALSRSSVFGLSTLEVVGASRVPERSIIEASGLRLGDNAIGLDLDAAASRVGALEGIRGVTVERMGALAVRIVVEERRAAVEIRSGSKTTLLDRDGVVVTAPGKHGPLPVVVVPIADDPASPGFRSEWAAPVVAVWEALPTAWRRDVGAFDPPAGGSVIFRLGSAVITMGRPENLAEKVEAIDLVRRRIKDEGERLVALDVSVPGRPAARTR